MIEELPLLEAGLALAVISRSNSPISVGIYAGSVALEVTIYGSIQAGCCMGACTVNEAGVVLLELLLRATDFDVAAWTRVECKRMENRK